jgi:hypothetical protein
MSNNKEENILKSLNLTQQQFEKIAEDVHNEWWNEKIRQGFHAPIDCPFLTSLPAIGEEEAKELAFTLHCDECHEDMKPYEELAESVKEYDRVTVKTVLSSYLKQPK